MMTMFEMMMMKRITFVFCLYSDNPALDYLLGYHFHHVDSVDNDEQKYCDENVIIKMTMMTTSNYISG